MVSSAAISSAFLPVITASLTTLETLLFIFWSCFWLAHILYCCIDSMKIILLHSCYVNVWNGLYQAGILLYLHLAPCCFSFGHWNSLNSPECGFSHMLDALGRNIIPCGNNFATANSPFHLSPKMLDSVTTAYDMMDYLWKYPSHC